MSPLQQLRAWLGRGPREHGPIGLELGHRALHLAQLDRAAGELRIRAARSVPFPEGREAALASPGALRDLVAAALGSRPFLGRRVVTALSPPAVKLMVLSYALDDPADEPGRILGLVEERVQESTDSLVIDYLPIRLLGEERRERSALVAVAARDAVIEHLERLRRAGLEVEALEITPVAVRRLVDFATRSSPHENALVLYCGRDQSHLTVLWGRRLVLYRELPFCEAQALEDLGKALDVDASEAASLLYRYGVQPPGPGDPATSDPAGELEIAEALLEILKPAFYGLAEQVEKALVYTASQARGAAPDRVFLLGQIAAWPRADRLLEGLVSLPVRVLEPARMAPCAEGAATPSDLAPSGGVALSLGLALRGQADG